MKKISTFIVDTTDVGAEIYNSIDKQVSYNENETISLLPYYKYMLCIVDNTFIPTAADIEITSEFVEGLTFKIKEGDLLDFGENGYIILADTCKGKLYQNDDRIIICIAKK